MSAAGQSAGMTMLDKIWSKHSILERADGETLLYVDRHLIHDGYAPAFEFLKARGLNLRAPHQIFATPDHYVPTDEREVANIAGDQREMVKPLVDNAREPASRCSISATDVKGIVHVVGPEQGISQPGMTIVCGDSHTSTHGALGALAFGIGMTQATQVLATQTLWQRKPKSMRITVEGKPGLASPPRTSSWRSSARSARRGRSAMSSSMPARRFAGSRWKGGSRSATCRSKPAPVPA